MTFRHSFVIVILVSLLTSCYLPISGKVIDAETQQPIDSAVVLVQWTEQHGFGFTYHTVYKMSETETDKNGKFSLPGAYSPFIDPPDLVIYKSGFVAWRNDFIFPGYQKRSDNDRWQHNGVYKLEKFKDEYSRSQHSMFMDTGIMDMNFNRIPKFANVSRDESIKATKQREAKEHTFLQFDFNGRIVDSETGEPIEGAIVLALYDVHYPPNKTMVSIALEGISDREGWVRVTGKYPWPYRLPDLLIYKKGYSFLCTRYVSERFKWTNGYIFTLKKGIPDKNALEINWAEAAANAGRPLMLNSIQRDLGLK